MTTEPSTLSGATAVALGGMLRRCELDAVELTEHFIENIERCEDRAIFISTCFDRAREEARQSAQRYRAGRPLGPLDGIPVAWKDLVDIASLPTTAGSAIYRDAAPATHDAPIVRHLTRAGMVTLGKTNLSEFAYSALGLNPHFGTPINPWASDVPRVPGGSSSGSAVAVAAGLVPVSIGTDTGGSVRTPAAFNGIVGFKPSEGWISCEGVFPLSRTLDTIGVFARDIEDCFMLDLALRGLPASSMDKTGTAADASLTVIVPKNEVLDGVETDVLSNFMASVERLAAAGVRVRSQVVPELTAVRELIARHGNIAAYDAYRWHRELLESPRHREIDARVYRRMMQGKTMSAADFQALQLGRKSLCESMWAALGDALLLMPTVPHAAPPIAALADDDYFTQINLKTVRNTILGNMLNMCGLALPNGSTAAQLPTSLLVCAPAQHEARLLRAGATMQRVLG
jgi:aspartyl-tRNA(Asn)/glutamyl-tRNA(Gln) amidotransferase subunit A